MFGPEFHWCLEFCDFGVSAVRRRVLLKFQQSVTIAPLAHCAVTHRRAANLRSRALASARVCGMVSASNKLRFMANPLKCDLCSKPATVHLTQIVNNKVHKVDLCEACAEAKGVTDPSGFSLADLLLKASLNPEPSPVGVRCEQCGFTQNDFKKHGRFGCPVCYQTFAGVVEPMLDNMHNGTAHHGKIPHRALE